MAKSNLILNNEWGIFFRTLPDEQAGMLIKALYACHDGEEVTADPSILAAFAMMSSVVIENARKYEEKCRKNSENRKRPSTNVNEREEPQVKENKKEIKIKEKDSLTRIQKERFVRPTVEEVREYCSERHNGIDPQSFVDFYESKGWKVGNNPMKDWKAAVRTWENKRKEKPRSSPSRDQWFTAGGHGDDGTADLKAKLIAMQTG